jgi:hypothetical protein
MRLPPLFLLLSALLLLLPGQLAAKYTENLTAQVIDYSLRPVEGAQAYVDYEINSVDGNVKTKPKTTDSRGLASIIFTDYEQIDSETNYAFTLYVKYGDQLVSSSLIAEDGENRTYSMMVDSHVAFVHVADQNGKPLFANVTVGNAEKPTDASGSAFFALPPGNYTVKVERGDLVKNVPLRIDNSTGDVSIDAKLSYYTLDILVQDDSRNPLQAEVSVDGNVLETGFDGHAHFENVSTDSPLVAVLYGQGIKRLQPDLKSGTSFTVTFDVTNPAIKDQYSTLSASGVGTVRFFVEDFGPEASGIDSVSVSYEVAGVSNTLSVYTIGYNSFEAKIPAQPAGTLVKYAITVTDKEGNSEAGYGNYVVPAEAGPNATNTTGHGSAQFVPSVPNEAIFAGIAVLAVLAYAAIYYYNKKKAGELPPQPLAPPQVPQQ